MNAPTPFLGRLARVPLRRAWASEARDFTPWLALPENLRLLGETVGIVWEPEAQEQAVGPFRADILAKNVPDGTWVLVENQLERTDHCHPGLLLTMDPTNREDWPRQHALFADRITALYKALAVRIERLDRWARDSESTGLAVVNFGSDPTNSLIGGQGHE